MPLRLTLENVQSMPDGGPVSYTVTGKRGIDIGRDQYLDWVLPDPNRVVSGKHCEIRYRDGSYWIRDVSTNGTFINRNERRMQDQHQLRTGDRIEIGHYIVNVVVENDDGGVAGVEDAPGAGQPAELWSAHGEAAMPVDPRSLRAPAAPQPSQSHDVLDWIAAIPEPVRSSPPPPAPPPFAPPPAMERPPASAPAAPPDDVWGAPAPPQQDSWGAARVPASPPPPPPSSPPPPPVPAMPRAAPPPMEPPPPAPPVVVPSPEPPPPMPRAAPMPMEPTPRPGQQPSSSPAGSSEVFRRFARGAGIEESVIAARDAGELAEQLGVVMRIVASNLGQLLVARAESKGMMRSSNQTLIQAADNNPLRFTPSAEEALAIMFGKRTRSYLDAQTALEQSFSQIKSHQVDTFAAIQQAIQQLVADLDPKEIEKALDQAKGGSMFANRKARLWDDYVMRWKVKAGRSETGLLGAFMLLFAEAYDKRKRQ